ncbi:16S rRNA (cytosine(1402)-N(4))-methyltransferase RsmH [Cyclobacterium jeungdonense]|uniref:Ribosomal RNA small subunit methyltransferase H n=1 Tax=Cyclobacterium jeungdonense TaxID=708087 RepID=A0ABT8C3V7_9BACT|nr:16S rRNA (cytosine(1402)-N(4))-methyltransferase RsmH [Cyclobacterium jeungdonense]MDN3686445.1 16S rRNA (cytosine(1402)-N(4))-methyltransferase RsmH [Cyclobacterium jeungdonense]
MDNPAYHIPVMRDACLSGLAINPDGIYLDLTYGGGGHAKEILKRLKKGHLYAFDQDPDAEANIIKDDRFTFIQANFRDLKRYLKLYGVAKVDGILADLGISSHQIDEPSRGFSTRFEGKLDMRMSQSGELTAAEVLNTYSEAELQKMLSLYGEVKNAKTLAKAIVAFRANTRFESSTEFKKLLDKYAPRGKYAKYSAQVYQALRIEVNQELAALEEMLVQSIDLLKTGGRLVVMSYHSLEDRLVKNIMTKGKLHGELEKDFYGNPVRPLEPVSRKAIIAGPEEVESNKRARSARLRIARKG